MRKAITVASIAALGFAGPALAEDGFSYNYVELGYIHSQIDNLNVNGHGLGLRGSYGLTENVHAFASYSDQDYDFNVSAKELQIGGGVNWPLNPRLDVIGTLSYVDAKISVPGFGSASDSGLGLGAALRGRLTDTLELRGGLDYVNLNNTGDQTTATVGARFYFNDMFALGADAAFNSDGTTLILGARFDFATF